jgi:arylsulfatase A-like enzyme
MVDNPPNVLLFVADDLQHDMISALGNQAIETPNFDRLVQEGTAYTRAYNMGSDSGAVCVPARSMIHSGRSLFNLEGPGGITEAHPTLGEAFANAGYRTFGTGKWHNGIEAFNRSFNEGESIFFGGMGNHWDVPVCDRKPVGGYPEPEPYPFVTGDGRVHPSSVRADRFSSGTHSSDLFVSAATEFIRDATNDETPFFTYIASMEPHDPRTPPGEYLTQYDHDEINLPENFLEEHPFDTGTLGIRDENLAGHPRTPDEIRRHIADYCASITHLDHQFGRVLDVLEETGQYEDTIIVVTADHGLAVGRHGLMGKQNLYDHSLRVPLILNGPGIPRGERRNHLCYQYELNPTLRSLASVPIPSELDAVSLHASLRDRDEHVHQAVIGAYKDTQRMIRTDRYKLIEYGGSVDRLTQLFDIDTDPHETQNLATYSKYEEVLDQLRHRLVAKCRDFGELDPPQWLNTETQ